MPAGAQSPPSVDRLTKICTGQAYCDSSLAQFREAFAGAYRRDYQGQRNVAFCFADGCDGAVMPNATLACAWRVVIVSSGAPDVGETDRASFRAACGRLDSLGRAAAIEQARELMQAVYKRPPNNAILAAIGGLPTPR